MVSDAVTHAGHHVWVPRRLQRMVLRLTGDSVLGKQFERITNLPWNIVSNYRMGPLVQGFGPTGRFGHILMDYFVARPGRTTMRAMFRDPHFWIGLPGRAFAGLLYAPASSQAELIGGFGFVYAYGHRRR